MSNEVPTTINGVAIKAGTQVLIRGVIPAQIIANKKTGEIIGVYRTDVAASEAMIHKSAVKMLRTTNETVALHQRYPLIEKQDRTVGQRGAYWWIEPNTNPATFVDAERALARWIEIYSNS